MSQFPTVRRLLLAGTLAAASAAGLAASAQAASTSLDFQCELPLVGGTPVTVDVAVDLPATAEGEVAIDPSALATTATLGAGALNGAASVEGSITTTLTYATPTGSTALSVPADFGPTSVPSAPAPVELSSTAMTPPLAFTGPGTVNVSATGFSMNLLLRKASGEVLRVPAAPGTFDSDGNPDTFDVACELSPAGQDGDLGDIAVGPGPIPSGPILESIVGPDPVARVGGFGFLRGEHLRTITDVTVGGVPARFFKINDHLAFVMYPPRPAGTYDVVAWDGDEASDPVEVTYVKRR